MNLITRRPPEDSLGDAGALAIFVSCGASSPSQLDLFLSSESCLPSLSCLRGLPVAARKKISSSKDQTLRSLATSHKYHRGVGGGGGGSAGRRRGKEKESERDVSVEGVAPRRYDSCRSDQPAASLNRGQQKSIGGAAVSE